MSEENKIELSVIMPALNEELNIADAISETLTAFDVLKIAGEIIVVNDGSSDRTQTITEEKSKETPGQIQIIQHDKPRGIGACFWEGVDYAKGDFVVLLPGDNENDSQETLRYYKVLEHVDIVIPFVFNKEVRSLFRNALSFIYRFIINSTFLVYFNYTNGTILYRKSILEELDCRNTGFFFQTDILIRLVKRGYLFAEVPYKLSVRKEGRSKAVSFPSLLQVIKGYFQLVQDIYFKEGNKIKVRFSKGSLTSVRRGEK